MPTVIFPTIMTGQWLVSTTSAILKSFFYLLHNSFSIDLLVIGVIHTFIYTILRCKDS